MSDFRKLSVYSKALDFVADVYEVTKRFPKEEQFGLTSQFKRAASSICANIAEGSGRFHRKDFAQFLRIAIGSSSECDALLDIAIKLSYVNEAEHDNLTKKCSEIGKMLNGLISSLVSNQ